MEKQKQKVTTTSIIASAFLMLLKLVVGTLTGSIGILSDALHSGLDLIATLITFFAVRISNKPPDVGHPFGYGKVENISALAETLLLFVSCLWVIFEASIRLLTGQIEIEVTWLSFAVMFISMVVSYQRATSLHKVAKETNSQALEADSLNFRSDIYSSAVVLVGLLFAYFGVKGADSVSAICVAIFVLYVSFRLGKKTVSALIDTAPKGLSNEIKEKVLKVDGVIEIERVRVRPIGPSYFVDLLIGISRKIPLEKSHEITRKIETEIKKDIPNADIVVHVHPIALKDETIAEQIQIIAANHNVDVHDISLQEVNGKKYINFDLEVDSKLNLKQAHQKGVELEHRIKEELGEDLDIVFHVEPGPIVSTKGDELDEKTLLEVNNVLESIKKQIKEIKGIRDLTGRKIDKEIFLSLSCVMDEKISIEKSHEISDKIEMILKETVPGLQRAIVHLEPGKDGVRKK